MTSPYTRWTELADDELTVDNVESILNNLPDDLWVAAACTDRLVDDIPLQQHLLQVGLSRTDPVHTRVDRLLQSSVNDDSADNDNVSSLIEYFKEVNSDALLCRVRILLLSRLDLLNTYVELCQEAPEEEQGSEDSQEENEDEWDDDPWGNDDTTPAKKTVSKANPPFSLSAFLSTDLLGSARLLSVNQWFGSLRILFLRHGSILWPHRFTIFDFIPGYANPADYYTLLPSCDNQEIRPSSEPRRPEPDWSESSAVLSALDSASIPSFSSPHITPGNPVDSPKSLEDLSSWYRQRVDVIISSTGLIDCALTFVQHAATLGIHALDEVGEELSLLSRLTYDAIHSGQEAREDEDWTLARWSSMEPPAVIRAYLAHSTPTTVAKDISRLVMPYLFVLESRAERAGQPDPELSSRLLNEYILSAPLPIVAAIFEASKPTLSFSQRLVKKDDEMVRLALACLYGNESLDQWQTMSAIFECLPVFNTGNDEDEADTTIASLGSFVTPSTSRETCTPSDLLIFFKPLQLSSLSRALDVLDIHLESGEILSRWSVPAPLRWFLQSYKDPAEQRAWANRMVRRAGGTDDQLNTLEDWAWLLEDMVKLSAKTDNKLGGAFCLLPRDEVLRIYLSGLLSTGRFDIAQRLLKSHKTRLDLTNDVIEDICLASSREFYDNASSGNYKFGEMKLAYDCLSVPPSSDRLEREKEFIEATSRLSSFNIMSRPGIPISPIEIRLTKDRLSLVSQVLSSNTDAYKHTEVILELVSKLGFKDDIVAEVKTLAMLADTALQNEDFERSYETSQRMIDLVLNLRASSIGEDPRIREASDVCWIACLQLGRQPEFPDIDKKLWLLGKAIEICPVDQLHDILMAWRKLEKEDLDAREERLAHKHGGAVDSGESHQRSVATLLNLPESAALSLRDQLKNLHMPSPPLLNTPDAAALASRTFKSVTANFPFSRGRSQLSQRDDSERSRSGSGSRRPGEVDDVQTQASRVFSKGIGWLIGADEGL